MAVLAGAAGAGHASRAVSSDLSVDEAVVLDHAGYEARGLVMGSSIYHIGYAATRWSQNAEIEVLSAAMYDARERAMGRLVEDGRTAGGEGVVGVRLTINRFAGGRHLAEFLAVGTAIGRPGQRRDRPFFTSALSGQDFYLLDRAGYRPLGMVMGTCVYHVARQRVRQVMGNQTRNVELPAPTEALYEARELAMERMQSEAASLGADGVVGVSFEERSHAWGSQALELFAVGTAVSLSGEAHRSLDPRAAVPLADPVVATDPAAITRARGAQG